MNAVKDTAVNFDFASVSNKKYTSMLYCLTMERYFYTLSAAVEITSADNGGKVANIELVYA